MCGMTEQKGLVRESRPLPRQVSRSQKTILDDPLKYKISEVTRKDIFIFQILYIFEKCRIIMFWFLKSDEPEFEMWLSSGVIQP